jgi:hypothetical protein
LNTVLTAGVAPGSSFTMWDPTGNSLLPPSLFDGSTWSINYTFSLGRGGLLNSPVQATNTFVGTVPIYTNIIGTNFSSGGDWSPNYANGLHLLSIPDPIMASGSNAFYFATGRTPHNGEWIETLDSVTQSYTTSTYHTGSGWDNGDPTLNVGQAAWFDLGPVTVPEPSSMALFGAGMIAVLVAGRKPQGGMICDA